MDAKELRSKSNQELRDELAALAKEQFNLRMQNAIGQNARSDQFSKVRKNIARVKTVMTEKRAESSSNGGE
ncbi:MAG: 50S ribosomal protein L29 [Gammaproteobacteria bacterium]|nr:50S ribosomal protein L29 [Gammaproteobacteria bacterium]